MVEKLTWAWNTISMDLDGYERGIILFKNIIYFSL